MSDLNLYIIIGIIWMLIVAFFVFGFNKNIVELVIKKKQSSVFREPQLIDKNNIIDRGDIRVKLEFDRDNEINPEELYHFIEDIEAVIERNRKIKDTRLQEKKEPIVNKVLDTTKLEDSNETKEEENNYLNINQLK